VERCKTGVTWAFLLQESKAAAKQNAFPRKKAKLVVLQCQAQIFEDDDDVEK